MLTMIAVTLGTGSISANDRTDKGFVSVKTWPKLYEGKEDGAGYWGSMFIPMQSLWDIDNRVLEKIKAPFRIEQIRRDSYGRRVSSGAFQNVALPEPDGSPRVINREGVTFAQYNSQYQAGNNSSSQPGDSNAEVTSVPLSDLLVPATQSE